MRPIPPVYFLLCILGMGTLNATIPAVRWMPYPWNLGGILLMILGILLSGSGARRFRHYKTAVRPFQPTTALVTDGPYRFTRNPMYLGLTLCLLGLGILLGSLSPLLLIPPFVFAIHFQFIRKEERLLEAQFGEVYQNFCKNVRRWI